MIRLHKKVSVLKLFTESLTRCPVIGWKTANHRLPFWISPNPYEGSFYELPPSFACVIPQSQHVPTCSLSHLNTKTCVRILFSICSTETKALFSSTQPKRNRKYKPVKRTLLSDKFPANRLFARTKLFLPLFYCKYRFFDNIFICVVFLSSCQCHNILLTNKVGKIAISALW